MPELRCTLSTGVWQLLQAHSQRTREPLGHIVNKALAAYFDVAHHTMYQVSTATALVEGIYQGAVRIGVLREHGDLGLGTFEDLDGEMVTVDGDWRRLRSGQRRSIRRGIWGQRVEDRNVRSDLVHHQESSHDTRAGDGRSAGRLSRQPPVHGDPPPERIELRNRSKERYE